MDNGQHATARRAEGGDGVLALLGASGVVSALLIVTATVVGVALRRDANHVSFTISELYETGAPNAWWLMILFTGYHALVIPLAMGLHRGLPRARLDWIGPTLLGMAGALGIPLGAYARCDPGCFGATTFRGQLHGILVLVTVPLIFGAMFAIWHRLKGYGGWRTYRRYTLATGVIGLSFGLGMTPFVQGAFAGLLERINVAMLLQWYVASGFVLIGVARRSETAAPAGG